MIMGFLWGTLSAGLAIFIEPYIQTKDPDRSLRGLLILMQRSFGQAIILTVLLAPLCEELLFRLGGFWLVGHFSSQPFVQIVITALAFGIAHVQFPNTVLTAIIGFMLGYIYWQAGLSGAVMAHATHNFWVLGHLLWRFYLETEMSIKQALQKMPAEQVAQCYEAAISKRNQG